MIRAGEPRPYSRGFMKSKKAKVVIGMTLFMVCASFVQVAICQELTDDMIGGFKGRIDEARAVSCRANLKSIKVAKEMWAVETGAPYDSVPKMSDLVPLYIEKMPACPSGGIYVLGSMSIFPSCSESGHQIE